jgi:hypothetical protein
MPLVFTQSIVTSLQHDLAIGQWSPVTRTFFGDVVTAINTLLAAAPLAPLVHEPLSLEATVEITRDLSQALLLRLDLVEERIAAVEVRMDRLMEDLGD